MTAPTAPPPDIENPLDLLDGVYKRAQARKLARTRKRLARPWVRIWDGDWNLRGEVQAEFMGEFHWKLNETGTGTIELPENHYIAKWIVDYDGRAKKNVHITVDKDGARWSGRMKNFAVKKTDNNTTLVVTFMHDYEELKWIDCWSNPLFPAVFQFPKVFILAGPAVWVCKMMLFVNLLRAQGNLWQLPDDPLDPSQYFRFADFKNWPIIIKPSSFVGDASTWTVIGSRWKSWHDLCAAPLEDAQLYVECRRWLTGDEPPWEGADVRNMRNGQLVIDILDKSALRNSSSGGVLAGTIFEGLWNTLMTFQPNYIEEWVNIVDDPNDLDEYKSPFWLGTVPRSPWVVYREGEITGIQSSQFTHSPATAVQVNAGGHSMPGVNEAISAGIQAVGDIVTSNIQFNGWGIGAQGGAIDALLKPLYEDTILAFMAFKSSQRANALGWSRYNEFFQTGADKAYTISSLMMMRLAFIATDQQTSYQLEIADGRPYLVGEQGEGHFFLGDRIGATIKGMKVGRIYVDQVTELVLAWDRDKSPGWKITVGRDKQLERPEVRIMRHAQTFQASLKDLGIF